MTDIIETSFTAASPSVPSYTISFHRAGGEVVGTLDFNGPQMVFTGDADESAKLFFNFIAKSFAGRLEQERNAEREKVSAWMIKNGYATGHGDTIEDLMRHLEWEVADRCAKECNQMALYTGVDCAAAIRAKYTVPG